MSSVRVIIIMFIVIKHEKSEKMALFVFFLFFSLCHVSVLYLLWRINNYLLTANVKNKNAVPVTHPHNV